MLRAFEERALDRDEVSPTKKQKTSHATFTTSSMLDKGLFYFFNAPTYYGGNIGNTLNVSIVSGEANQVKYITNSYYKPSFDSTYLLYVPCDLEVLSCILSAYSQEISDETAMNALVHYINLEWIEGAKKLIEFIGRYDRYYITSDNVDDLLETITILSNADILHQDNEYLYHEILIESRRAKELKCFFRRLIALRVPYQGNELLYGMPFRDFLLMQEVESFLITLQDCHIYYQGNDTLYNLLFNELNSLKSNHFCELSEAFLALKDGNIVFEDNKGLYELLVTSRIFIKELTEIFLVFNKVKLFYKGNEALYENASEHPYVWEKVTKSFVALSNENITYQGNEGLYKLLFLNLHNAEELANAFIVLNNKNIPYQSNEALYEQISEKPYAWKRLVKLYVTLSNDNITYQGNEGLYKLLFLNLFRAKELANTFIVLKNKNIPYQGNEALYEQICENYFAWNRLLEIYVELSNQNISYQGNEGLYKLLILSSYNANELAEAFIVLFNGNIPYQGNEALYEMLSTKVNESDKLAKLAVRLAALNIPWISHLTGDFLLNMELAIYNCKELLDAGYNYQLHSMVFDSLLHNLSIPNCVHVIVGKTVKDLLAYAKHHSLQTTDDGVLIEIIESNKNFWDYLSFGPLEESSATKMIEHLLKQIVEVDINEHTLICFNAFENYILNLPAQKEINLSLLIRNANLSHLHLEDSLIEKMGNIVKKLIPYANATSENRFVKIMSEAHRIAINLYVGNPNYKNINKFFRSEQLDFSLNYRIHPVQKHHILLCFLIGCIVNDAVSKLNNLVDVAMPEKVLLNKIAAENNVFLSDYAEADKLVALLKTSFENNIIDSREYVSLIKMGADNLIPLFNIKKQLDRGEFLEKEHINARLVGVWKLPAITSLSVFKEGSSYFHKPGTYRSKFENAPSSYVIREIEGEVLLAQGEYVVTHQGPDCLISTIVRSPDIATPSHLQSELALSYAQEHHLTKDYNEVKHSIVLNGIEVVRPNHNATHTYRVMLAIGCVSRYFAHYAKDPEFKHFCLSLKEGDLEWLRVAAAFSITGRESEIAATMDLKRYESYRIASAEHFKKYNVENGNHNLSIHETLYEIVRYMGNPEYEAKLNTQKDAAEKKYRNYYHRLLTVAHKLDLVRCYNVSAFQKSMQHCFDLSEQSDEQQEALNDIIRYMIELIKAHGGALKCDMALDGTLVDVAVGYQDIYAQTSHSLKRLFDVTQTVPKPDQEYDKKVQRMKLI